MDNDEIESKAGAGDDKGKSGGSKSLMIIIIAAFLVFMLVAGAGFFILWKKLPAAATETAKTSEVVDEAEEEKAQDAPRPVYPLDAFVVNLVDAGGQRFLRVKMDFELSDQALAEQLQQQLSRAKDKILTLLSSKEFQEINSIQGKSALREEIATTMNSFLTKGKVTNVYFTEFVVE